MEIENYIFQAQVVKDDGSRASVVIHVHSTSHVFAGTHGIPEPSAMAPPLHPASLLIEAVLSEHKAVPPEEHVPYFDPEG